MKNAPNFCKNSKELWLHAVIPVVDVHGGHVSGQRVGPGRPPGPSAGRRVDGGVGAGEVLGQRGAPLRGRAEHALQRRGRRRGRRQHHLVATILLIVHFFHSSPFSVAVVRPFFMGVVAFSFAFSIVRLQGNKKESDRRRLALGCPIYATMMMDGVHAKRVSLRLGLVRQCVQSQVRDKTTHG